MTERQSTERTYAVPDDEDPIRCPECDRPFADDSLLALHRGQRHRDRLGEAALEEFDDAYAAESERLRLFRLKALLALIGLYFGLLMTYALV